MVCHVGKAEDRSSLIQATLNTFGGLDVLGRQLNPLNETQTDIFFFCHFIKLNLQGEIISRFIIDVFNCLLFYELNNNFSFECRGKSLLWPYSGLSRGHVGQDFRDQRKDSILAL